MGAEVIMLYDKYTKEKFSEEIFKNPPNEFRAAPFWAWNSKLEAEPLCEQIDKIGRAHV